MVSFIIIITIRIYQLKNSLNRHVSSSSCTFKANSHYTMQTNAVSHQITAYHFSDISRVHTYIN